MLGWMLLYLLIGIIIGGLIMADRISDYVKAGVMERRGRIYRIVDVTDTLKEIKDDHVK
ncbi:hypothetical protein AB4W84_003958 [Salmonella enterica]|uniref:hypothetical protein n=1 Tax=Cronobacter sakazakii TaxID=28141 RepID=UPI0013FDE5BC|nr:hypothetical protein [Cronobacter sakazakii]EHR9796182.1 hypothetical protein [Salmonella enterica]EIQ3881861.1 hypothetical protein [Salmonella enterica]EJQ2089967.1 hypothetical protein [Cronobacter sakazakii]EJR9312377.1 hypothetical protein [Cronobacter sakazakii]EJR9317109.1 hypothetical protein [Cronobacter sakazakii]